MFKKLVLLATLLSILPVSALAVTKTVNLAWDPVVATDLAGYRIYRAPTSNGYAKTATGVLDSSKALASIVKLATGVIPTTYSDTTAPVEGSNYYVATAFDTSGNESGPSNEVVVIDTIAPNQPGALRIGGVVIVP